MRIPCALLAGAVVCLMIGPGCRHEEPPAPRAKPPAADQPAEPAEPAVPSDAETLAIERVTSTGGSLELDEAGFPVRIDLASERVFADEDAVRAVLAFPGLKGLRLAVSSVSEQTLADLAKLTQLDEFLLQDAAIGDVALAELLRAMPGLKRLTLRRLNGVSDVALDAVAACRQLEVLALIEMNQLTGTGLERLAGCPNLRSLDLRNCGRLSPDDFKRLAAIEGLVELKAAGPAINDTITDAIVGFPKLQSLTIEDAEITGGFFQKLASDPATAERIRTLAFARCYGVTDEALEAIDKFPNLETLSLRNILVTGTFLIALSDAGKGPLPLTTLIATNAFLNDEAVRRLPELTPNLLRLDLRGNGGLAEGTRQAADRLKNLKELKLE